MSPKLPWLDGTGVPQQAAAHLAKNSVDAILGSLPPEVKPHLATCVLMLGADDGGPYTVYAANVARPQMVAALEEFLERLRRSARVPS